MTIDYTAGAKACKLALERLGGEQLKDIQWEDPAQRKLAYERLRGLALPQDTQYDEVSFFIEALAYCELQAEIAAARAKVAQLVTQRPAKREEADVTAPPLTRLLPKDPLETAISDAELAVSMLEIKLDGLQSQVEGALRRWTMLCFSRCCEEGNCCHVQEAMAVLPSVREAEKEVKTDETNPTLLEKLEAHRQRLTDAVVDAMRASSYFVNLMAERAGDLYREFIAVLVHTFGWVVDMIEEERARPPRPRFS
jgi:hypothetical protein